LKKLLLYLLFLSAALFAKAQTVVCVTNNSSNNNINIRWTESHNPCGPFVKYYIYGGNSAAGPFHIVDSTNLITDTTYTHVNALALNHNWYYFVVAIYNCPGFIPINSDTVQNAPPVVPTITVVTMTNGYAQITWTPSPSPQTCFYVIYYDSIRGNSERHDTVWGRLNTTFIDSHFVYDANISPINYTVEANDCCGGNNGPVRTPQRTIFTSTSIDRCEGKITINWTPYTNWPHGIRNYSVLVGKNGATPVPVGLGDTSNLTFNYSDFNDFDTLCIVVAATSNDGVVSASNKVCQVASIVQKPKFIYLTDVTVNNKEQIEASWVVDTFGEMYRYLIERKSQTVPFQEIYDMHVDRPFYWEQDSIADTLVPPNDKSYIYRVKTDDECDNKVTSSEGRNIVLKVDLTNYYEFTLTWNPFEIDYGTVTGYEIWRDNGGTPVLLATIDRTATSYVDDVSGIINQGGYFCYRVIAKYNLSLPNGYRYTLKSRSNKVCDAHRPIVYIPNAIVPDGENRIFKPSIVFGDVNGYTMLIFNRWGEQIFQVKR